MSAPNLHPGPVHHTRPGVALRGDENAPGATRGLTANVLALLVSGVATGALGLVFWVIAGRLYPVDVVGTSTALINSAILIASLSGTSVGAMYERFLPLAGSRTAGAIRLGQLVVLCFAVLAASLVIAFGPSDALLSSPVDTVAFVLLCVAVSWFALQDHVATGLGVARWAAYKNVAHSVVKLVLVVALSLAAGTLSMLLAWAIPTVVAAALVARRLRRLVRATVDADLPSRTPPSRQLWSYFAGSAGILGVGTIVPLVVPLIVVARFGVDENAYFAIAWSMVTAAFIALHTIAGPLVSAAADGDAAERRTLLRRFVLILGATAAVATAGLALMGPLVLQAVGPDYAEHGRAVLYAGAGIVPSAAVTVVFLSVARIRRRLGAALTIQAVNAVVVLSGAAVAEGIASVAAYFTFAEAITAILAIAVMAWWRRSGIGYTEAPR